MEFLQLALKNFKRFAGLDLKFSPGINLLWGPNESGKSTVHEAINCALFGRERNQTIENWNGGSCQVELTLKDTDDIFRLQRGFTDGTLSFGRVAGGEITDASTKKSDVEEKVAGITGFASRDVFDNSVSVRQMRMSMEKTSEFKVVGAEIQRILTGAGSSSASEALKSLENARDDIKGRVRHANVREYDSIAERLGVLAGEKAESQEIRRRSAALIKEIEELREHVASDSERLALLEGMVEKYKHWSELKKQESELDILHKQAFSTLKKIREIDAQLARDHSILENYTALVDKDEEIYENISQIRSKREEFEERLKELGYDRNAVETTTRISRFSIIAASVLTAAGAVLALAVDEWFLLLLIPAAAFIARHIQFRISARVERLAGLAAEGLNRLETEEKSVLGYINCRNTDEALLKIRNYRDLIKQTDEMEITRKALLGDHRLKDWEEQESELARDLSGIRRELKESFADYSPTTQEIESWRSEYTALQKSVPADTARLNKLEGSLDAPAKGMRDLAAIEGEIDYLHLRKDELDFLYKAYDEAADTLRDVIDSVSDEYIPALSERAAEFMKKITSGRYDRVKISPDWDVQVDCEDKAGIDPRALSTGTSDQLYMSLRIACGERLSDGKKLPVILDDPFAGFDESRLINALELLKTLSEETQILLFTHDPMILKWAQGLEKEAAAIHLLNGD